MRYGHHYADRAVRDIARRRNLEQVARQGGNVDDDGRTGRGREGGKTKNARSSTSNKNEKEIPYDRSSSSPISTMMKAITTRRSLPRLRLRSSRSVAVVTGIMT